MKVSPNVVLAVLIASVLSLATTLGITRTNTQEKAVVRSAPVIQVPHPQVSSTGVDDWRRFMTRASRDLKRVHPKPTLKPRPVTPNVQSSVSRETSHVVTSGSASAWAHQAFSIRVANCESGGGPSDRHTYYDGDPHLRDSNGHYGKWQFAPSTWYSVGGTGNAADASEAEQDYRAWLLWKRDGWGQWECSHLV